MKIRFTTAVFASAALLTSFSLPIQAAEPVIEPTIPTQSVSNTPVPPATTPTAAAVSATPIQPATTPPVAAVNSTPVPPATTPPVAAVNVTPVPPATTPMEPTVSQIQAPESTKPAFVEKAEVEKETATIKVRHHGEDASFSLQYPENYAFPLVGIQFPIDYSETFASEITPLKTFSKHPSAAEQFVNEQVVRSSYLACSLYEHLCEVLPDKSVVLIPTKLQFDKTNNRVVSIPVSKPVPPVVLVDLFSEINLSRVAAPSKCPGGSDTFGEHSKTLVSMSMPINGKRRVFAGQPVIEPESGSIGESVESFYNLTCNGKPLKTTSKIDDLIVSSKGVYAPGTFVSVPTDFKSEYKELLSEPAKKQVGVYSNIIIDALNNQSLKDAKNSLIAEYAEDVDPELAEYLLDGKTKSAPALFKNKFQFFNHCLLFERQQLISRESLELSKTIYGGDFAQMYRKSLKGEADYARQLAASQRRSAFGSVLAIASTAGAVAGAFAPTSVPISGMCMAIGLSATAIVATECKLQKQLRADFRKNSEAERTCEVKCVVMLDNDKVEVDGSNLEAHRKNVIQQYQKQFGTTVMKQQGVL